jgi:hypothetical protein
MINEIFGNVKLPNELFNSFLILSNQKTIPISEVYYFSNTPILRFYKFKEENPSTLAKGRPRTIGYFSLPFSVESYNLLHNNEELKITGEIYRGKTISIELVSTRYHFGSKIEVKFSGIVKDLNL